VPKNSVLEATKGMVENRIRFFSTMAMNERIWTNAPPNAVKIKVIHNRKEIAPQSEERSAYYPATDEYTHMPSIEEQIQLRFNAKKIDSSGLTIQIDTADGQHAEVEFDLRSAESPVRSIATVLDRTYA